MALLILFAVMVSLFAALASALPKVGYVPFGWGIGFACGVFLRDIRWFRAIRANWQFSERVTDWNLVQQIADGDVPAALD